MIFIYDLNLSGMKYLHKFLEQNKNRIDNSIALFHAFYSEKDLQSFIRNSILLKSHFIDHNLLYFK